VKRILLFFVFMILFAGSVAATAKTDWEYESWSQWANNNANEAVLREAYGYWSNISGVTYAQVSVGANFQPIVADLDNDGSKEIVTVDGNFLQIYSIHGNTFNLDVEENLGAPVSGNMIAFYDTLYNTGYNTLIVQFNNTVRMYEYLRVDGIAQLDKLGEYVHNATLRQTVICDEGSLVFSYPACWAVDENGDVIAMKSIGGSELYIWGGDVQSDGTLDKTESFAGKDGGYNITSSFLVRNVSVGVVQGVEIVSGGYYGAPDVGNNIYDVYLCNTTATTLSSNSTFGADCDNSPTLLVDDLNVSQWGTPSENIVLTAKAYRYPVQIESNYIVWFVPVNVTVGDTSRYDVMVDSAPTDNLIRLVSNGVVTLVGSVAGIGLIGDEFGVSVYDWYPDDHFNTITDGIVQPVIFDFDYDGNTEIVYLTNCTVSVWDAINNQPDSEFDGDGEAALGVGCERTGGLAAIDLAGGGDRYIVVTYIVNSASESAKLAALKSDGSLAYVETLFSVPNYPDDIHVTPPVVSLYDDVDVVCAFANYKYSLVPGSSTDFTKGGCYDMTERYLWFFGDSQVFAYDSGQAVGNGDLMFGDVMNATTLIAVENMFADEDNDDTYNLVTAKGILKLNSKDDSTIHFTDVSPGSSPQDYYTVVVDANDDGSLDICGMKKGSTFCAFSGFNDVPPTLDNTKAYGGYGSTPSVAGTICVNSSVIFKAQEQGYHSNYNYYNDVSADRERIVTNCGLAESKDINLQNGSWSLTSPSYSCFYDTPGVYEVRLYLQDEANDDDYSEYNIEDIVVNVIDGVPGITCSAESVVLPGQTGVSASSTTTQRQDVNIMIDTFTGANNSLKFIIGIAIIIAITGYLSYSFNNPGVTILGAFLGGLLVMGLGLINVWIFIIVIVVNLVVGLLWKFISNSNQSQ